MINQLRTLLLNLSRQQANPSVPGYESIPEEFSPLQLPTYLTEIQKILFGARPDQLMLNYRVSQLLRLVHASPLQELVFDLDPRVTYKTQGRGTLFDALGLFVQNLPGTSAPISVLGTDAGTPDGRNLKSWRVHITSSTTLDVIRLTPDRATVSHEFNNSGGVIAPIPLHGSSLSVQFGVGGVFTADKMSGWLVQSRNAPVVDLSTLTYNLSQLSNESVEQIFGDVTAEPNKSIFNLWQTNDLAAMLVAAVLAFGYRTTELLPAALPLPAVPSLPAPSIEDPVVIDGGELYFVVKPTYSDSLWNQWRRVRKEAIVFDNEFYIADGAGNLASNDVPDYLPPSLVENWSELSSIGWGIYDVLFVSGAKTAEFRDTLTADLNRTDHYSWLWTEHFNFLLPEGQGSAVVGPSEIWRQAIRDAQAAKSPSAGKLLLHGSFADEGTRPTPDFIAANIEFIRTNTPFDGQIITLQETGQTFGESPSYFFAKDDHDFSYEYFMELLSPIVDLNWGKLTDNFAWVYLFFAPDVFSDWSHVVQKFQNIARACKDSGLKGVVIDNEPANMTDWCVYPNGAALHATVSLHEYQAQALVRGQQVMQAMLEVFPDICVMELVSPIWGLSDDHQEGGPYVNDDNRRLALTGAFHAGLIQATQPRASLESAKPNVSGLLQGRVNMNSIFGYESYLEPESVITDIAWPSQFGGNRFLEMVDFFKGNTPRPLVGNYIDSRYLLKPTDDLYATPYIPVNRMPITTVDNDELIFDSGQDHLPNMKLPAVRQKLLDALLGVAATRQARYGRFDILFTDNWPIHDYRDAGTNYHASFEENMEFMQAITDGIHGLGMLHCPNCDTLVHNTYTDDQLELLANACDFLCVEYALNGGGWPGSKINTPAKLARVTHSYKFMVDRGKIPILLGDIFARDTGDTDTKILLESHFMAGYAMIVFGCLGSHPLYLPRQAWFDWPQVYGEPTGPIVQDGMVLSREFGEHTISINLATRTTTIT